MKLTVNSLYRYFLLGCVLFVTASRAPAQSPEELLKSTEEIEKFVSSYRGLAFLQPVTKKVQDRQQTEAFLKKRISEEYSTEEIDGAEHLLKRLGLLPPDYDYYTAMVELMTEQLAGMYDHQEKFLAIADWLPFEMQGPILAHELTHALQDQHYGLEKYLSPDINNDDQALALASLVEGDASLVMFAFVTVPEGRKVTDVPDYIELIEQQSAFMEATLPRFAAAPRYIKQTLMFSYSYGTEFVKDFLLLHSWQELESLYRNPPSTTEQIMHPEKFFGEPDLPQDAEAAARRHFPESKSGGDQIFSNVLGEFVTYLLLREELDEETAREGAAGWDGDLVVLKKIPGTEEGEILEMTFCWDSEAEAFEFRRAYEQYLLNRYQAIPNGANDEEGFLAMVLDENRISIVSEGSTLYISTIFP